MGQDISATRFSAQERATFDQRLAHETVLARQFFAEGRFVDDGPVAGVELEAWLLDHNFFPAPRNQAFLARLADPMVVAELSLFNIELNCAPQAARGGGLRRIEEALSSSWARCLDTAHQEESTVVAIGTLPTVREADLCLSSMTPSKRYLALNQQVLRARQGHPLTLDISGIDELHTTHADVMLEAGTTSFQVHWQVPPGKMSRTFNASLLLSGPLVALAANSPFLFGRALWHETRVPLFEQSVDCGDDAWGDGHRVTFGHGYLGADPTELFTDNLQRYPVLLPLCSEVPPEAFAHLRLHNGTVWRWNRLLVGGDAATPHLRIEQRVMPAGPTFIDMLANAAFYYGCMHMLARRPLPPESGLPFEQARANFYAAARGGLQAEQVWFDGRRGTASELLVSLLPLAREGLAQLEVDRADAERYLDVIEQRLRTGQNGAAWQLAHHARHGDLFRLTADYLEHQRSARPVHEWPL